jgi:hypothetical protein
VTIKIAIVGPEESKWKDEAQKYKAVSTIRDIIYNAISGQMLTEYDVEDARKKVTVISGHCPKDGVDIWVEERAKIARVNMEIFAPEVNQWNDKYTVNYPHDFRTIIQHGYRSRNIKIAEACDVLYCIVPSAKPPEPYEYHTTTKNRMNFCNHCNEWGHPTNGGCWTMQYTKKLGKETHLVVIE